MKPRTGARVFAREGAGRGRWSALPILAGVAASAIGWSVVEPGRGTAVGPDVETPDAVGRSQARPSQQNQMPPHAGFTFTRIRYGSALGGGFGRRGGSSWAHDYPNADRNIQTILGELTAVDANTEASYVFDLEDPEIFRNPVLYISEPGFWSVSEEGARNLRNHLLKGGFLIFDDFEGRQWDNMAAQMARALPEARWVEIDGSHPIFQSFFSVEDIYVPHPLVPVTPAYYAIFEDDDPNGRIMVLANHNSDLAEYWEWSAQGFFAVDPTNDAYRLGVNYIIYALTH